MLKKVSDREMFLFLREIYPTVNKNALMEMAKEKIATMEDVLEPMILGYLAHHKPMELSHGEFSLSYIMGLRGCKYPRAVLLMDGYIKDAERGKYEILRR